MPAGKRPLLTRSDVILVIVVASGVITPLTSLAPRPSGWMFVVDAILSALLGLLVVLVIASGVRVLERWWTRG